MLHIVFPHSFQKRKTDPLWLLYKYIIISLIYIYFKHNKLVYNKIIFILFKIYMNFPVSPYPPSGYNDGNFNRTSFPSNIYPSSGEMTGNLVGRFNPISTNSQYN